jgi:hypothetical protein
MLLKLYTIIPRKKWMFRDHLIEDVNDSNSLDLAQKNDWGRTKYIGYYAGQVRLINQKSSETPK